MFTVCLHCSRDSRVAVTFHHSDNQLLPQHCTSRSDVILKKKQSQWCSYSCSPLAQEYLVRCSPVLSTDSDSWWINECVNWAKLERKQDTVFNSETMQRIDLALFILYPYIFAGVMFKLLRISPLLLKYNKTGMLCFCYSTPPSEVPCLLLQDWTLLMSVYRCGVGKAIL